MGSSTQKPNNFGRGKLRAVYGGGGAGPLCTLPKRKGKSETNHPLPYGAGTVKAKRRKQVLSRVDLDKAMEEAEAAIADAKSTLHDLSIGSFIAAMLKPHIDGLKQAAS